MKTVLIFFMCGLLSAITSAAQPFSHMETGIPLPDTIAGTTRGEATNYEVSTGEPGVAIPYHANEIEITVFIRRIDPKKITSAAMLIDETLATVKQLEASGGYSNVKVFKSADDSATPGWSKAAFTARSDQGFLMSMIYATIRSDYAIKARITTPNPKNNDSIQKFVAEFQKIVNEAKPKA
ncbi:hypothetical protein [Verrucomicrobium spinosum]|uniref:hypothetical protein n=1 Tax=Verrucomicrobium spinosum TaxID=2736 RepID=UPI0012F6FE0F|nr:hypothetical protein [Verrucomicrobium spinosum]